MPSTHDARILFRPEDAESRFLPEGPYSYGNGRFSWVAIQHGPGAATGSLNMFDLNLNENQSYPLPGRPGCAYPTDQDDTFILGMERSLRLFNTATGGLTGLVDGIDADVEDTRCNDGLVIEQGLIFGTGEPTGSIKKAGLYFWRTADRRLTRFRNDQICSNGKALHQLDGELVLLDIDSLTQTVVAYPLDLETPALGDPRIIIDMRGESTFPDGMVLTPDATSLIIAMYNPGDAPYGEVRQYGIQSGQLEAVWRCDASPQVTCPQLVLWNGKTHLIITTAAEHMSKERNAKYPNAGCLFIAETQFDGVPDQPRYSIGEGDE